MDFGNFDWQVTVSQVVRLVIAYLLAMPIGWDREREARGAGLRTFPLVAVGSCGFVLLGIQVLSDSDSQSRILYGLMTGIGFIGGGAILKRSASVHGTATAASIWITGAIGASVAWHHYEIAIVLSALDYITLRWVRPLKGLLSADEEDAADDHSNRQRKR